MGEGLVDRIVRERREQEAARRAAGPKTVELDGDLRVRHSDETALPTGVELDGEDLADAIEAVTGCGAEGWTAHVRVELRPPD